MLTSRGVTKAARRGFTLMELLVAMTFVAIVIPVTLAGMRVAGQAGEIAQRKLVAARIANRELNELRVEHALASGAQRGQVIESGVTYYWSVRSEMWIGDPLSRLTQATVTVEFTAQGRAYSVPMSTLDCESQ